MLHQRTRVRALRPNGYQSLLAKRRTWYADEAPNTEAPKQDTDTAPEPNAGQQQESNERLFTQADIDRIVADRAKRAAASERSKLLEDLGVDDPAKVKAMLDDYRKKQEAEMTEAEKALAEAARYKAEAEAARAELAAANARQAAQQRRRVIESALSKGGANDVDNLSILVNAKLEDKISAVFGEDNAPDDKALTAFVKDVQAAFPAFFGTAGAGSPSNAGGISPTSKAKAEQEAQAEIARKFGKI
jgi:DNA-binding transcriptional MerR regulator